MDRLSDEMLQVATQLKHIRLQLVQLVRQGSWPDGMFKDMSRVIVEGSFMVESLQRLAEGVPSTPTNYDPSERR